MKPVARPVPPDPTLLAELPGRLTIQPAPYRPAGVLYVLLTLASGCSSQPVKPITTFDGHCRAVLTPPDPDALVTRARYFAPESIRVDFTRLYDSLVVVYVADAFLDSAQLTDTVVRELRDVRMIGAWREGTHL